MFVLPADFFSSLSSISFGTFGPKIATWKTRTSDDQNLDPDFGAMSLLHSFRTSHLPEQKV
jgi:hypothetical protein